jgi:hypothetical protein
VLRPATHAIPVSCCAGWSGDQWVRKAVGNEAAVNGEEGFVVLSTLELPWGVSVGKHATSIAWLHTCQWVSVSVGSETAVIGEKGFVMYRRWNCRGESV